MEFLRNNMFLPQTAFCYNFIINDLRKAKDSCTYSPKLRNYVKHLVVFFFFFFFCVRSVNL